MPPVRNAVAEPAVRSRVRHLRVALAIAAVLGLVGAVAGILTGGGAAALGVVAGVALVAASYTASTLAIAWADSVDPRLVFPVGMAMYVTKFSLFAVLLLVVGASDWAGTIGMAIGIVAGVIGWIGTQIWWTLHHEHPYLRPAQSRSGEPRDNSSDRPGGSRPGPPGGKT